MDVIIDDVNDNPPVFSFHRIVVNISEKSFVGDVISLDQFVAKDDDIGKNKRGKLWINLGVLSCFSWIMM